MRLETAAALFETAGEIADWLLKASVIVAGILLLYQPIAYFLARF